MTTIKDVLEEIAKAIPKVVWLPDLFEIPQGIINFKAYTGQADEWKFLVVGVDVPTYDPIRQYHGSATKRGLIIKLPSELARAAGEIAEAVRV